MSYCKVVLLTLAGIIVLLGALGLVTLHPIFQRILISRLPIEPGSETYEGWKRIPLPIYQHFYFFNVTNPYEFLHENAKPVLQELGPYTYRSEWVKEDVQWNENGTLQYRERKRYWFERTLYAGSEDDMITTINTPLVATSQKLRNVSPLVRLAVSVFLNAANETVFIKRSVKQLTYEGYTDILAKIKHILDPSVPAKNGKFAYMAGKNDSDEGMFNVYTGRTDLGKFNQIDRWNGRKTLPWWPENSTCSTLYGTNGEMVSPVEPEDKHIDFFNPAFCRPWRLSRVEDIDVGGLKLARFVGGPEIFYNSTRDPTHGCFERPGRVLASGGMDISACQFGLPIVLSFPHFYAADPEYVKNISGLVPNPAYHEFRMDIEPRIGITVGLAGRVQINVKLERVPTLVFFDTIPEIVFPVFWQELSIEQTMIFTEHVKTLLDKPVAYATVTFSSLVLCGGIMVMLICIHCFCCRRAPKQDRSHLLYSGTEPEDEPDETNYGTEHGTDDVPTSNQSLIPSSLQGLQSPQFMGTDPSSNYGTAISAGSNEPIDSF